jgi:outer membrane murein-binding lipoprotein Lpp
MNKIAKKLRKLKAQLDKLEEKEHEILDQIDDAIEELEENNSDD